MRTVGKVCTCFCNIKLLKINVFFMKCCAKNKCMKVKEVGMKQDSRRPCRPPLFICTSVT